MKTRYDIPEPEWLEDFYNTGELKRNFEQRNLLIEIHDGNVRIINNKKNLKEKESQNSSIIFFVDGPLLPMRAGAPERFYNLAKFLSLKNFEVSFIKCHREFDDIKRLKEDSKKTGITYYLVSKKNYYNFSDIVEELIKTKKFYFAYMKHFNIVNYWGKNLKKFDIKILYDSHDALHILLKRLNKYESGVIKKIREAHEISDIHTCVSEFDKKCFEEIGCNEMVIIPNGSDCSKIKYNYKKEGDFLFLGHLNYYPNKFAVKEIINKIVPFFFKNKFLFVGNFPNEFKKYKKIENVKFTGIVGDLNPYFKKSSIALAPIYQGSGTRVKILYYFAAGIPTIATNLAVEGLDVHNGKHLLIEDDIRQYPQVIKNLINNPDSGERMAKNARKLVEKRYDWGKITNKLVKKLNF